MFNGDTLNCRGWLTYRKAGRAGLVFVEAGGTGGADDSWRDLDREAELAYEQSLEAKQAG
jgi:predicted ATPase